MENRTQKSARNMSVGLASQAVTILLSFFTRTVFVQLLTTEYLGLNGLFSNVLTLLSFAELGIGGAMTYAMYAPAKENDSVLLAQLLQLYKKAYQAIALIVLLIGFVLSFFLNFIIAEQPAIPESLQVIFWLFVLNNVCSYLVAYKQSVLIAYQDTYVITITRQIISIAQQVFQIVVLLLTHQYLFYLFVQIACTVLNNAVISFVVNRRYPWLNTTKGPPLEKQIKTKIIKDVKALSISKISGIICNGADNVIISKLLGLDSVGLVSNYLLVINALNGLLWSGLSGVTSSFGNFNVDSSQQRRREVFDELYLCSYWLYGFLCVGILSLINPFITIWLGEEYLVSNLVVFALVLTVYVGGVDFSVYTFHSSLGMFKQMQYPYFFSGILNIILSVILGRTYGLVGIYLATSISRIATVEVAAGYYVYKLGLGLPFYKYVYRSIGSVIILGFGYGLVTLGLSFVTAAGVPGFIIKLLICTVVFNAFFFLCFSRTAAFKSLTSRVLRILKYFFELTEV